MNTHTLTNQLYKLHWLEDWFHVVAMRSKIRLAKQFPFRTEANSKFPIEQHGDLELVPEFTGVHEEHFNPKCASHPSSELPLSTVANAVLGHRLELDKGWLLCALHG